MAKVAKKEKTKVQYVRDAIEKLRGPNGEIPPAKEIRDEVLRHVEKIDWPTIYNERKKFAGPVGGGGGNNGARRETPADRSAARIPTAVTQPEPARRGEGTRIVNVVTHVRELLAMVDPDEAKELIDALASEPVLAR